MALPVKIDRIVKSPYCRKRKEKIRYIVLHCSTEDTNDMIKTLNERELSVHYIINERGKITQCVPPEMTAYHAGKSKWGDSKGISLNDSSIGIELVSPSLGQNPADYSRAQRDKLRRLLHWLVFNYNVRRENIVGHSDIAPTRKPDPGIAFDWHKLYKYDLSVWYRRKTFVPSTNEKLMLQTIGYDTTVLPAARCAFCRRFMPDAIKRVDSIKELVEHPYPEDFMPDDWDEYMHILRCVTAAFVNERKRSYWFESIEKKK